jgi:hypothetical protein
VTAAQPTLARTEAHPAPIAAVAEPVPELLPGATDTGPVHQVAPGRVQLGIPGVGRVLVRADGPASLDLESDAGAEDAGWLLGGPARQAHALLGGRFALAAAGVVIGGRAVALIGGGASGKSVAAAALAQRGHGVLADSALEVEVDAAGRPVALPTRAAVDLWPDVLDPLGLREEDGATVRPALPKRAYAFAAADAALLHAIVALRRQNDAGETKVRPRQGGAALHIVLGHTAMEPLIGPLGAGAAHFEWAVAIARAASTSTLVSDRHDGGITEVVDAIQEVVA